MFDTVLFCQVLYSSHSIEYCYDWNLAFYIAHKCRLWVILCDRLVMTVDALLFLLVLVRADRRRMVELREETGVQRSLTERLVRSRLQWTGHVERMADDRLPKRAAELREQGRRRRGRPRLRWEDCVKRDVRKAGEEEDWKKKTRDRRGWKILSDEAVKKLRAAPHP